MPFVVSVVVSFLLLAAGTALLRSSGANLLLRLAFGAAVFFSFLLYILHLMADHFTGEGVNEAVIYHLRYGLDGAGFGEYRGFIAQWLAIIVAGLAGSFGAALWRGCVKAAPRRPGLALLAFALVLASIAPNPAVSSFVKLVSTGRDGGATDFYRYYRQPFIARTDAPARNLVFIYAEGLERTFFNEQLFPDLIEQLRGLEAEATTFTNIHQVGATEHTIAGIVASQCGIPMTSPFLGNRMGNVDQYLPGAIGLGDLLQSQGYFLSFLGGAPLEFAGKGKFFRTHKFDEVLGRDDLILMLDDPKYLSAWGLYDDSLLDIAFARFLELAESKERFGLFLLTLDTHQPKGHVSRSAAGTVYGDGENPMLNAVAASDRQIAEFIRRIRNSPFGADTVVVVASDHLALENTATDILNQGARRNLFMVLEPGTGRGRAVDQPGSTFDIGPTVLPFLGFTGEIGLGRNLLADDLEPGEIAAIHDERRLQSWRDELDSFWRFPRLEQSLRVDVPRSRVVIDERSIGIPVLIKFDSNFSTSMSFPYHRDGSDRVLIQELRRIADDESFMLIDRCENAGELSSEIEPHGWCVVAGTGKEIRGVINVERMATFSRREIRRLTGLR